MNQTVLPQLQSVESELASQESQLTEQLASVREKLSGIRAVMPMFTETADRASEPTTAEDLPADELKADAPAVEELEATDEPEPKQTKAIASKQTTQKQKQTTTKRAVTKKTTAKKDGRTASWQKYSRPGVKNESIPDAVRLVLATQPEKDFKIAEVMEALFEDDMPKAQYLKARNRVSNVLSGGVRAGDWHRGERSTYRMSAA